MRGQSDKTGFLKFFLERHADDQFRQKVSHSIGDYKMQKLVDNACLSRITEFPFFKIPFLSFNWMPVANQCPPTCGIQDHPSTTLCCMQECILTKSCPSMVWMSVMAAFSLSSSACKLLKKLKIFFAMSQVFCSLQDWKLWLWPRLDAWKAHYCWKTCFVASHCPENKLQLGICEMHRFLASLLWLGIVQTSSIIAAYLIALRVSTVGNFPTLLFQEKEKCFGQILTCPTELCKMFPQICLQGIHTFHVVSSFQWLLFYGGLLSKNVFHAMVAALGHQILVSFKFSDCLVEKY